MAIQAMKRMDEGSMSLTGAYREVRESIGRPVDRKGTPITPTQRPLSKKSLGILSSIYGQCMGLESIPTKTMSPEDAKIWYGELGDAIGLIKKMRAKLKEIQ